MKSTLQKTLAAFAIFGALLGFSGCENTADATLESIKSQGTITIGVFGDKPPFGYIDAQGKNAGFDVFIAKKIAKDLLGSEDKVRFVLVEAANRVEFLKSNKVHIMMANFTRTDERAQQVDFATPYMKVSLGVVSKDGAISDVAQLKGKTLIVNKGTTADFYFSKNHPDIKLLKFEQNTETFAALQDGRGDALAHDNTLLFAWAKENPGFKVGIRELGGADVIAPAVKKGNTELLAWLNSEIETLQKSGFLLEAYAQTLQPVYGDDVHASEVVFK